MISHGNFQLAVSNRVLIAQLSGSWNEEAAQSFDRQFRELADQFEGKHWGHLVLLDDWELGVPDIEPIIAELTAWCIDNHLTHAAQIFSPSYIKKFQLDKMVTEKIGNFERRQFKELDDGVEWLHASGYSFSVPEFLC